MYSSVSKPLASASESPMENFFNSEKKNIEKQNVNMFANVGQRAAKKRNLFKV